MCLCPCAPVCGYEPVCVTVSVCLHNCVFMCSFACVSVRPHDAFICASDWCVFCVGVNLCIGMPMFSVCASWCEFICASVVTFCKHRPEHREFSLTLQRQRRMHITNYVNTELKSVHVNGNRELRCLGVISLPTVSPCASFLCYKCPFSIFFNGTMEREQYPLMM